jgi:ATP-binding cassette subfamily B protein
MMIVIAHRLSTIEESDRIYVMEKGNIVEEGKHETLLDLTGMYYALWRGQKGARTEQVGVLDSTQAI